MQPQRNRMGWAEVIAGSKQLGLVTVKYTDEITPKPYSPETELSYWEVPASEGM
jgi:hypothetical protein